MFCLQNGMGLEKSLIWKSGFKSVSDWGGGGWKEVNKEYRNSYEESG